MITIKYEPGRIEVTGHAGYADNGQDIVCASISMLVQNLIWSIVELTSDLIKYDVNAGDTVIIYTTWNLSKQAQLLIDSFFIGCRAVADNYPEYVRMQKLS